MSTRVSSWRRSLWGSSWRRSSWVLSWRRSLLGLASFEQLDQLFLGEWATSFLEKMTTHLLGERVYASMVGLRVVCAFKDLEKNTMIMTRSEHWQKLPRCRSFDINVDILESILMMVGTEREKSRSA